MQKLGEAAMLNYFDNPPQKKVVGELQKRLVEMEEVDFFNRNLQSADGLTLK